MYRRLIVSLTVLTVVVLSATIQAEEVPHYVNFQSVLRDDSGNIVADGFVDVQMKILDQASSTVYEETQPGVQVVRGAINIMIGEGVEPGSSPAKPTGGIPLDALDPAKGSHSLQIQFGSNQPSDPMELGSVPYAVYAETALKIDSNIIGSDIPDIFVTEDELVTAIQDHENDTTAHPASSISVTGPLNNSSSTTVQSVLQDYDTALSNKVSKAGDSMSGNLTMNADIVMQGSHTVDGVDVSTLPGQITNEANTRSNADTTLQNGIDSVSSRIDTAHNLDGTIKGAGYSAIGFRTCLVTHGNSACSNSCMPTNFTTAECGNMLFIPTLKQYEGDSGGTETVTIAIDAATYVLSICADSRCNNGSDGKLANQATVLVIAVR